MTKSSQRIPLYTQIRQYIQDQITQKIWLPNDRIPSENEFASQFGVSRITVKNALAALIEEGIIFRVQGKGSFVSPDTTGEPFIYRSDSTNDTSKPLIAYLMPRLENMYTAQLLSGVESELSKLGYRLIFCRTHDSQDIEKDILREVIQLGVKGIIIFPVEGETYSEEILRLTLSEFPLVVLDRYLRGIETNCVCSDNVQGAHEATSHLVSLGHTRIGFVSTAYQGTTSIEDRLTGYEKSLADHNIPVDHSLRLCHFDNEQTNTILQEGVADETVRHEVQSFLRKNPDMTAVFAINSAVGLTIMEAAVEIGIHVPEDLSIVFFDNYELSALSKVPPTCVSQQEKELGKEAVRLLDSIIKHPKQERRKILLPTKLIVRKSTAVLSVEQPSI
ncbi:LacI family transcriptional regulator [Paenibacillus baekrokdamisoli]|uniref:LacI family transcriptional regulator n=1 Tax=Paenibacillus baekrokdamisoli TaxID=1712516 RepID=A0A3G9IYP7_9BACL|nr:GntR family transcriptional regulator [Paenibacillus baekrokdamisoli]MBB3068840.1 GntR family transcriptional regulator of arabinose operon [Paenibacillus baekrokdamisoli]BBH23666.1 LacI family transcriptional regulator [Paenibacillus baekrokdamisoli]